MEIFKEFGINPILVVANIVNFTILLVILKKFLYKPVLKTLDERKAKIAQSLKNAEEIEAKLAKAAERQEEIIRKANSEATVLIVDASKQAKELIGAARAESKELTEAMLSRTKETMSAEKEKMMHDLKSDLATLVVESMTKVTGKILNDNDQKRLISEAKKEMEA